jgi:hypothetical protein
MKNGYGVGLYWLEGEELIVSTEVTLTADWQPLAFAPDDPSRTYTKAIWEFGGKKFHFHVKWSGKGHTAEPRMSVPGLSQCYGAWYAGDIPYEHELYNGYGENGLTTDEAIRKMGLLR